MRDADADANVVRKKAEAEAAKRAAVEAAQARKKVEAEAQAKKKVDSAAAEAKRKAAARRTVVPDSDDPDPTTDLNQPPVRNRPTRIIRARGAHLTVNTGITAPITTTPAPPRTPATPAFESELARRMRQMSVTPDPDIDDRRPAYLQPNPNFAAMRQGSWRRGDQPARTPLANVFASKKRPVQTECVS
jgi:hypothetical protein